MAPPRWLHYSTIGVAGQVLCTQVQTRELIRPGKGRGAVFSYYEFKQPLDDRLTDEAWQAMDPKPDRPAWTSSFER